MFHSEKRLQWTNYSQLALGCDLLSFSTLLWWGWVEHRKNTTGCQNTEEAGKRNMRPDCKSLDSKYCYNRTFLQNHRHDEIRPTVIPHSSANCYNENLILGKTSLKQYLSV